MYICIRSYMHLMFVTRLLFSLFFLCYGDHRDLHVLTHSFPTRRSSDLRESMSPVDELFAWKALASEGRALEDIAADFGVTPLVVRRSEEHTSELQSIMRISYAVFCLKKKTKIR